MADTSTIGLMLQLARQDASPLRSTWTRTVVADETLNALFLRASTTGVTADLSAFDSIDAVILRNRSQNATETVRIEYQYSEFTQTFAPNDLRFAAAGANDSFFPAAVGVFDFASSDYRTGATIEITGASAAANNGVFLIEAISNTGTTTVLCPTDSGFQTVTPDDQGPVIEQRHAIASQLPSGALHVANRVYPGADIVLTAADGEPKIDLWVLGS